MPGGEETERNHTAKPVFGGQIRTSTVSKKEGRNRVLSVAAGGEYTLIYWLECMNYTDEKQILQQFGDSIINCVFERVCAQSVSKNIPM